MEAQILPRGARARNARAGGAFGIAAGVLIVVAFLYPTPSTSVADQLTNFNAQQWEIVGILDALVLLAAIPLAAYLRSVLEGKSPGTASAGAMLFVIGVTFGGLAGVIQAGAMSGLSSTYNSTSSSAADKAAALLAAQLLANISTSIFSIVLIEAGVVLFSIAMLNSRVFANWVADVGVATAAVLIVALAIAPFVPANGTVATVVFLVYFVLLVLWVFASSAYLLRAAQRVTMAAPVPT